MESVQRAGQSILPNWMDDQRVKCKGVTGFMYPNRPSSEVALAKALCNGLDGQPPCYFRHTCLQHAIDHHEPYGVWGGTSERDRRKIQRARNVFKNTNIYDLENVRFPGITAVRKRTVVFIQRRTGG